MRDTEDLIVKSISLGKKIEYNIVILRSMSELMESDKYMNMSLIEQRYYKLNKKIIKMLNEYREIKRKLEIMERGIG